MVDDRLYLYSLLLFLEMSVESGREAVSHIVGRDPGGLDEHGVARAGIESLAENFADGVVAPIFWYLLFGFPGMAIYKAVNTMDSMIGYKNERYRYLAQLQLVWTMCLTSFRHGFLAF